MMCSKCSRPFCWLCLHSISPSDPYGHFNARGGAGGCVGQLFDGVVNDDDDGGRGDYEFDDGNGFANVWAGDFFGVFGAGPDVLNQDEIDRLLDALEM
jgi:hypothetical protein